MNDDNSGVLLTRRRLLGGLTAIGAAGAASGAGTWAYFRDTEESTGNTVHAGTMDLKISDSNGGYDDGVSGTWSVSDFKPGDSFLGDISLKNTGSLEADHVEFGVSVTETESDGPNGNNEADTKPDSADGMAEQFEVTTMTYNGTNILADLSDANGNGLEDIADLASGNDGALDDLTPPPAANSGTESLTLGFQWAHDHEFDNSVSGVNNDYQGDEFDLTVTMALHQDDSQDL